MRQNLHPSRSVIVAAFTAVIPFVISFSGDAIGQGKADAGAVSKTSAVDAGAPSSSAAVGDAGPSTISSSAPIATSPDSGMDGATYTVRLRDLEARVDELKDQIRRSHNRLAMLSDTILSGGLSGSRAEINFSNEMSSAFRLIKAIFIVDGAPQYSRADDTGALAEQHDIPVYTGSVPPGDHTIQAVLTFQGNGYGVFTYLRGYRFESKSAHSFTAVEGKTLSITAVAYEKGGVTTALQDRPNIEWKEKVQAISATTTAPAAPAAPVTGTGGGTK